MIDIPPNLPPPVSPPAQVIEYCVNSSSQRFRIHPLVIKSIIEVEGGKIGTLSLNSNGSYDMGIMQINTINLPMIRKRFPKLTWSQIAFSPCTNIAIGTWLLSRHLKSTNNDVWKAVGNYHSKTPKYHKRYLRLIGKAYRRLLKQHENQR